MWARESLMPRKKRKAEPEPRTLLLFQGSRSGRWYVHLNNPSDISRRIGPVVVDHVPVPLRQVGLRSQFQPLIRRPLAPEHDRIFDDLPGRLGRERLAAGRGEGQRTVGIELHAPPASHQALNIWERRRQQSSDRVSPVLDAESEGHEALVVGHVGACQDHVVGDGSCRNQNVSNTNRRPSPQERSGYLAADPRGLVVECKHLCVLRPCEKLRCAIDLLRLMPSAHYFEHRHRR